MGPLGWVGVGFLALAGVTLSLLILSWSVHRRTAEFWQQAREREREQRRWVDQQQRRWAERGIHGDSNDAVVSYPSQRNRDWDEDQPPLDAQQDLEMPTQRLGRRVGRPPAWLTGALSSLVVGVLLLAIDRVWK